MAVTNTALSRAALGETLRTCQFFSGLPYAEVERVAAFARLVRVPKGAYVFREGEPVEGFYVIQTGCINVHRITSGGREQVIHIFRAGQTFAEAALTHATGYPGDARAEENSSLALIPKAQFIELLRERPELSLRMLTSLSTHLKTLVGLLEDFRSKDVETRLAHWLLQRCPAGKSDCVIHLQTPKRVLAAEMSTTSETLSRTLARFRDAGILEIKGRSFTVLSRSSLEKLLRKNLGS